MGRNEGTGSIKEGQPAAWEQAYHQEHPRWRGPSDLKMDHLSGKVLELGCGDGKTAIALAESGLNVTGLDRSRAALLTLSRRIGPGKLDLVQGDALDLPFKDGEFDSVTAVHFVDHLLSADRKNAVKEIGRVLRRPGVVVGRFFSVNDMRFGKGEEVEHGTYLKGNGVINHYFSEDEILDLFAGYEVLSIEASSKETKFSGGSERRSWITAELKKR